MSRPRLRPGSLSYFLALIVILGVAPTLCQVSPSNVDSIFSSLNSKTSPGLALLVLRHGQPILRRTTGVTDLRTLHPITPETNFRLASFTKQFTAACIMLLVHDGKLHYDDHLTDIFPDFPYGKNIAVRHLLTHTSGLPDYEDLLTAQYPNTPDEKIPQIHDAGVLKLLEQQSSGKFPPGSKWDYSNSGYATLAMIVEKISGEPFGQFLHDRIFAPLHMDHTLAYEKGKNQVPNRAYGYTKENNSWRETDQSSTSAVLGDGGIYSNLDDLAKWDAALRDHTLLTAQEMQPAHPTQYGFGWFLDPYKGHPRMWHYGETVGFRTAIECFPKDDLTVIVLANRADAEAQSLALKVAELYLEPKK
jgi:CubicO group peptidase (beta-lactamase class C family)